MSEDENAEGLELVAFAVPTDRHGDLAVAQTRRAWMDDTGYRFAYRCLPLVAANGLGWELRCPVDLGASWTGGDGLDDVTVTFPSQPWAGASGHFGHGVLTFSIGFLFRTEPGHLLLCKGPANHHKDGIAPLEGLVETDWLPFTFTMNWRFTRAGHTVRFERGEPLCQLIPYPRHYLERWRPAIRDIAQEPTLERDYQGWRESREEHNRRLATPGTEEHANAGWQRDYYRGGRKDGTRFEAHQTRIRGADWTDERGDE